MIVNPQLFNYRLIIGTLVVAIVVLGSYSLTSYNTLKKRQDFVTQETKLVQNELSALIALYDDVSVENEELSLQLQQSKTRMKQILDSLNMVKANIPLISKFKNEIASLKLERKNLFNHFEATRLENESLNNEVRTSSEKIKQQQNQLVQLTEENIRLSAIVEKVAVLTATKVQAKAIKTGNSNYDLETNLAQEANNFEVCFTIQENAFSPKGNKDIYVQILGPDNNIVSDRGSISFGDNMLIYSGKTAVNYVNNNLDVCTKIYVNAKEPLKEGNYIISVFHEDKKLGTSEVILN